jgi:hypothetical protein
MMIAALEAETAAASLNVNTEWENSKHENQNERQGGRIH